MKGMKKSLAAALLVAPTVAFAWPWSTDMVNQPSIKPQEGAMVEFPARSIPVMGIPTQVSNREEAKELKNPFSPTDESSLKTGKVLFQIYCAACHGNEGLGDSPVTPKIGAIPLNDDYVQKTLTEGWLYGTITFGSYVMPAYGTPMQRAEKRGSNDLSVEERWHVVNYIRNRLVQDAKEAESRMASAK